MATVGADAKTCPVLERSSRSAPGMGPETMVSTSMLTSSPSSVMRGRMFSEIPVARWTLPERRNTLGETIPEPNPGINWLIRYRPSDDRAWDVLGKKAQSGVYIPMPGKTAKITADGERRVMDEDEFKEYARIYGELVKKKITANADAIDRMSPESADLWVKSHLAPLKEVARRRVGAQVRGKSRPK